MAPNNKLASLDRMAQHLGQLNLNLKDSAVAANAQQATAFQKESAFLPLTHPKEEQQTKQLLNAEQQVKPAASTESVSYWDWPAEESVQQEETIDLFSVSNIQSNLIQEANRVATLNTTEVSAEHDAYWAEASDKAEEVVVESSRPLHLQNNNYWDWNADSRNAEIEEILQQEAARQATSIETIQEGLLVDVEETATVATIKPTNDTYWAWDSPMVANHVGDSTHPTANYWDWHNEDGTTTVQKSAMITALLQYEAARQLLSATHMEDKLKEQASSQKEAASESSPANDAYWTWSEGLGDQYWDERPTAVQTPAITTAGYWDW